MKALVTGAAGAVGTALVGELLASGWRVEATDRQEMDVTDSSLVWTYMNQTHPDVVFHLAGLKLAVEGELDPWAFTRVNVQGTVNVVKAASACGAAVVFGSTCKAADPETAYGASKMLAERVVLNAGQRVIRFFNIPECGPSVFDVWRQIPEGPIPFTDCWRYFISLEQAIETLIWCSGQPAGRYAPDPGEPRHMRWVAKALYPDRELVEIPRRRGDRAREPLHASCETLERLENGYWRLNSPYDPVYVVSRAVAA